MIWPSSEAQEARNAYTDSLLRERDDYEDEQERREENQRLNMQARYHRYQESRDIPGFCFACGLNVRIHPPNNPPMNTRKETK
jgi:hypothetical protein